MPTVINYPHNFGPLAGPIPLSYLGGNEVGNFSTVRSALSSLNTYKGYGVTTGTGDAYVVNLGAGISATLEAGLWCFFKAHLTNANGACTINVQGLGVKSIITASGADPIPGTIVAGGVYMICYNGADWQLASGSGGGGGNGIPIGTMLDYGGSGAVPDGFLLCDGTAVSRTTYSDLFGVVGTTWGAGDTTTTFNLPDSRRRVPMGKGGSGTPTIGNAVGNTGGSETNTLTNGQLPSHFHTNANGAQFLDNSVANLGWLSGSGTVGVDGDGATASTGGGEPHNNIQPSYIVQKIICAFSASQVNSDLVTGECILIFDDPDLTLLPRNGNKLVIDSQQRTVPDAGVSLAATSLSINTNYFIYAYMDGSDMALEASIEVPVVQAGTGFYIMDADPSRAWVGFARTISDEGEAIWIKTDQFNFVRSLFNEPGTNGGATIDGDTEFASTAAFVEADATKRAQVLTFANERIMATVSGSCFDSVASGGLIEVAIGLGGIVVRGGGIGKNTVVGIDAYQATSASGTFSGLSLGLTYVTILGKDTGGDTPNIGADTGISYTTVRL